MKPQMKKILNIIIGSVLSLLIFGLLTIIPFFFYNLHLGYFPILDIKDFIYVYAYCLVMCLIVLGVFALVRRKNLDLARGLLASLVFVLMVFVLNTLSFIGYLTPEPFDQELWKSEPSKPLEMVHYITRNDILKDKTRHEVIDLLGSDYRKDYSDNSRLTYHIKGNRITFFQVNFDDQMTVKEAYYTYND